MFTPLTKLKNPVFFFSIGVFSLSHFFGYNWRYSFVIFLFFRPRVQSLSEWHIIIICHRDPVLDGGLYELPQIELIPVCYSLK